MDGLGDSTMNFPTTLNAIQYNVSFNANNVSPLAYRECLAAMGELENRSCIITLFLTCRPAAILRDIRAIVVNSIERLIRPWFSHVSEEFFKTRLPSFADRDATPTVASVVLVFRSRAAVPHVAPNTKDASAAFPMDGHTFSSAFVVETPARLNHFGLEVRVADHELPSAHATAVPNMVPALNSSEPNPRITDHGQPSKQQPCHVGNSMSAIHDCILPHACLKGNR